jgi:hypothetical protein
MGSDRTIDSTITCVEEVLQKLTDTYDLEGSPTGWQRRYAAPFAMTSCLMTSICT